MARYLETQDPENLDVLEGIEGEVALDEGAMEIGGESEVDPEDELKVPNPTGPEHAWTRAWPSRW